MKWRTLLVVASVAVLLAVVATFLVVSREGVASIPNQQPAEIITTAGLPPSPDGATFFTDFGASDLVSWHELGFRVLTLGSSDAPPGVDGGVLAQGSSLSDRLATYFERESPEPVQRMGAEVRFPGAEEERSQRPAVAMIIADGPLPDLVSSTRRPNFGVHFVATQSTWEVDVWPGGGEKVRIAGGIFETSTFPRPLRYEIQREGPTVRVVLPDGTTIAIRDDRIERFSGRWSTWELYQDGGGTVSAGIRSWWAR